ncbi:MAG: PH domain-containing protein [Gammaproteobacteria bacterium]|nr:PH domain-containing protein [Gammaproteobacteria bacterium]
MGRYVESNLIRDEVVKYEAKTSIWSLLPLLILGTILLFLYGLGIVILIIAAIKYFTTELAITNKRVIAKFGFISRQTVELNISKVESIQVDQSILGRIFNFGSVVVSGAGNPRAPIPGISNPLNFRKMFFEIQEEISSKENT